jgi:hypothetical protein
VDHHVFLQIVHTLTGESTHTSVTYTSAIYSAFRKYSHIWHFTNVVKLQSGIKMYLIVLSFDNVRHTILCNVKVEEKFNDYNYLWQRL